MAVCRWKMSLHHNLNSYSWQYSVKHLFQMLIIQVFFPFVNYSCYLHIFEVLFLTSKSYFNIKCINSLSCIYISCLFLKLDPYNCKIHLNFRDVNVKKSFRNQVFSFQFVTYLLPLYMRFLFPTLIYLIQL